MLEFLQIFHPVLHYSLHLIFPGLIAWVFFKKKWKSAWVIMIATMVIDLDHLVANPIFDPNRCGIGFHPLHSYYAISFYFLMLFIKNDRYRATLTYIYRSARLYLDYIFRLRKH